MKQGLCIILTLLLCIPFARSQEIKTLQARLPLIKDSLRYVDALNRLSILYYERNMDTCQEYAREALDIAGRKQYVKGKADALDNFGIISDLGNNPTLSFRYYNDALDLFEEIKDSSNIVQLMMNIGLVLQENGKNEKSIQYFKTAIQKGYLLRKDSIMSLVLTDYLTIFLDSIPKDTVPVYLEKARRIATHYHDTRSLIAVTQTEGMEDLKEGKRSIGVALLKESAADAAAIDANYIIMDILQELGDYFLQEDDQDTALAYYTQALRISVDKKYNTYTKQFSRELYDYYTTKGNTVQAEVYSGLLLNIYREEEASNNLSGVDYLDYAIAEKELDATKARSENRKLVILILSIFSLSAVVIGLVVFQLYRLKQQHAVTLEALNRAVSERNNQLQQKHEFNNKLVSLLAHDFRQPINTARSLAVLLKDPDALSEDEMKQLIQSIEMSSDAAIDIFENILQWIKRQLSGFSYQPVPLDLRELVGEAMRPFLPSVEQGKVVLVNAVSEAINIHADKELLQFINRNLIHNAIKFSPPDSSITVTATVTSTEIIVCIRDEGKGINPHKLPQLFNFKKELLYDSEKEKGAGVALMICKDFIDRMFGRIWAENGENKGAVFFYALPIIGR